MYAINLSSLTFDFTDLVTHLLIQADSLDYGEILEQAATLHVGKVEEEISKSKVLFPHKVVLVEILSFMLNNRSIIIQGA
jgi:hypothetical protein